MRGTEASHKQLNCCLLKCISFLSEQLYLIQYHKNELLSYCQLICENEKCVL